MTRTYRVWLRSLPLLLAAASPVQAGSQGRICREICGPAIATCVAQGLRRQVCEREVLHQCRHGVTLCSCANRLLACTATSTTTTTSLPAGNGQCLGAAACTLTPSDIVATIGSADELRRRLLGLWYDCKNTLGMAPEPFGGDAAGIEFVSDGRWFFLRSHDGTLVRETGFGRAGTYEILDTSVMNGPDHFQLNLNLNSGYLIIAQWSLAATPSMLLLNNQGVQTALYAHMPGAPACTE